MNLGGTIRINRTGICIIIALCLLLMFYMSTDKSISVPAKTKQLQNLVNVRSLLVSAIEAARLGGQEVINVSKLKDFQVESKGKTKEGAPNSVTSADIKSHCAMVTGLRHALQTFPNVKIISEERTKCERETTLPGDDSVLADAAKNITDDYYPESEVSVWIDPLDATQEFTERLFQYVTTMVCVAIRGKPIIGVIHKPFENKTSWAWVDKTMSKDLQNKPKDTGMDNPTIIISRSHAGEVEKNLKQDFGPNVKVIKAGGAGYKILEVARGNATAYIHTTVIKKWDICAGNAIIEALNGRMTTLNNDPINYPNADKAVNDKGLITTLYYHDSFIEKLKSTVSAA